MTLVNVLCLVLAVLVLLPANDAMAQTASKEYKLKAAFMYKFVDFIAWPHKFENKTEFSVCMLGKDNFEDSLIPLKDKKAKGLPIKIRRNITTPDAESCDMLFISNVGDEKLQNVLQLVKGKPVLTIGESGGFDDYGGMIAFLTKDNKIRFDINKTAAAESGFTISSDLLKLANVIK